MEGYSTVLYRYFDEGLDDTIFGISPPPIYCASGYWGLSYPLWETFILGE